MAETAKAKVETAAEVAAKDNGQVKTPDAPLFERTQTLTQVIDRRVRVYGEVVPSFERIARVWSGILGTEVSATDVALCMIGTKVVRSQITPDYSDNSDDIDGYLDIFRKIVGPDMVHARTVDDYIVEKNGRG